MVRKFNVKDRVFLDEAINAFLRESKKFEEESELIWKDGKPVKWYYAIPVISIWLVFVIIIINIFLIWEVFRLRDENRKLNKKGSSSSQSLDEYWDEHQPLEKEVN